MAGVGVAQGNVGGAKGKGLLSYYACVREVLVRPAPNIPE